MQAHRLHLMAVLMVVSLAAGCLAAPPDLPAPTLSPEMLPQASEPLTTQVLGGSTPTLVPSGVANNLKVTVLYDNTAIDSRLKPDWGFAALVEYGTHTLLFDTGAVGSILLDNMRELGVKPQSIEAIVLSHEHGDHTSGLQALMDAGDRPTIYTPFKVTNDFKERLHIQTNVVEVTGPLTIFPGVHLTRTQVFPVEQTLALETRDGTAVLIGCAHPGLATMVRLALAAAPGRIRLVAGGFHVQTIGKSELAELRQLGVESVMPTHCTGQDAIKQFQAEYGDAFVAGGVGRTVGF